MLLEGFAIGTSFGTDAVGAGDDEAGQREGDGLFADLNLVKPLRVARVA